MMSSFINTIKQFLNKPFLMWEYTVARKLLLIQFWVVSSIIFVKIFDPAALLTLAPEKELAHYVMHSTGAVLLILFFYFIIPLGFKGYFKEENRTIGRELIWATSLILMASAAHRIDSHLLGQVPVITLIDSIGFTLGVSLFPFLIWLFLAIHRMTTENPANQLLELSANVGNDKIKVQLKDLLYIKSLSNYSEVYFTDNGEFKMRMLRIPLSTLATQLNSEYCIRCHRSYIVNLFNLIKIEGNTNTSKIHQRGHGQTVPVSKSRKEDVLNRLKVLPISHIS